MTFGRPLLEATCSDLPQCEANLKNLLEVILSPEALKQDLPTVIRLLEHPFFESARRAALAIGTVEKPYFKLSNHLKEALQEAVNKAEQRLRDEQKVARHQKRLVKVQEMMSSEEEMKKRKHKLVSINKKKFRKIMIDRSTISYFSFIEKGAEIGARTTFFLATRYKRNKANKW